ncbi:MAG: hypothetical protein R3Y64_08260, partial [Peptostreptococcaceae bacterium]
MDKKIKLFLEQKNKKKNQKNKKAMNSTLGIFLVFALVISCMIIPAITMEDSTTGTTIEVTTTAGTIVPDSTGNVKITIGSDIPDTSSIEAIVKVSPYNQNIKYLITASNGYQKGSGEAVYHEEVGGYTFLSLNAGDTIDLIGIPAQYEKEGLITDTTIQVIGIGTD